jgi:hypothetical protein
MPDANVSIVAMSEFLLPHESPFADLRCRLNARGYLQKQGETTEPLEFDHHRSSDSASALEEAVSSQKRYVLKIDSRCMMVDRYFTFREGPLTNTT